MWATSVEWTCGGAQLLDTVFLLTIACSFNLGITPINIFGLQLMGNKTAADEVSFCVSLLKLTWPLDCLYPMRYELILYCDLFSHFLNADNIEHPMYLLATAHLCTLEEYFPPLIELLRCKFILVNINPSLDITWKLLSQTSGAVQLVEC